MSPTSCTAFAGNPCSQKICEIRQLSARQQVMSVAHSFACVKHGNSLYQAKLLVRLQVAPIVDSVRDEGDAAVLRWTSKFDKVELESVCCPIEVHDLTAKQAQSLLATFD